MRGKVLAAGRLALAAAALWLLLAPALPGEAAPRVLLNTSHTGEVSVLYYDEARGLLFSGGEDGTVRVWDAGEGRLRYVVRVSHRPVQKLSVHPREPYVAVLVGEDLAADTLSVWNWETGRQLYTLRSPDQLLHLSFSPQGTFLLYSRADFKSLFVLDARSGRTLPYLREGFGIVSYFVVSRQDENVMTYQPSGAITYRDIRSGRNLKQVQTLPDLSGLRISPNNRMVAAAAGDSLVVVDVLSGAEAARTRAPGIVALAFSPVGNELCAISAEPEGRKLRRWYFGGRYLMEMSSPQPQEGGASALAYAQTGLYVGSRNGTILAGDGDFRSLHEVARDLHLALYDLDVQGDTAVVAASRQLLLYTSGFFAAPASAFEGGVEESQVALPWDGPSKVETLDAERLLVARGGEENGELAVAWPGGATQPVPVPFDSALTQLEVRDGVVLVSEKSGTARLLDPRGWRVLQQVRVAGLNRLVFAGEDALVAGKSTIFDLGAPLLRIDRRTGETVPVADSNLLIYDLRYLPPTGSLVSIGVEQSRGRTATVLKLHYGVDWERTRVLDRFDGEDLQASLALDGSGRVYSSMGFEAVSVWDGRRLQTMEASGAVPRKLYVFDDKLYSINRDYSITIWSIPSRRVILEVHILHDLSLVTFSPQGGVYASPGAEKYLSSPPG